MRKTFATTVDENLQEEFKQSCKNKELKINEVLEALMKYFIDGNINVEVKTVYTVESVNKENEK